jgi:hypothetical protein
MNLSGLRYNPSEMKVKAFEWNHVNVNVTLMYNESE